MEFFIIYDPKDKNIYVNPARVYIRNNNSLIDSINQTNGR